jgi:hypothetical protein
MYLLSRSIIREIRMRKPKSKQFRGPIPTPTPPGIEVELSEEIDANDPMEGPEPVPRIDRRHVPRISYQTTAWLAPADDTGPIRRPIIRTRDLNPRCMGFITRQDISALGEAILRLPTASSRGLAVACKVRRSLELGNGWFDCLIEFLQPQPDLATRHAQLLAPPAKRTSHKRRRPR